MRWPEGPPHLAPNPPYFFLFCFVLFCLFLCCFVCFCLFLCFCVFLFFCFSIVVFFVGGFKGQVRWPEGPPRLALNTPYCFLGFLVSFPFFASNRHKTLFSP